jgi:YVTN family beta-propeller protein
MKYVMWIVMVLMVALESCKESEPPAGQEDIQLEEGVFILNQGTFTAVNATLSYYETGQRKLSKGLFQQANGSPLGDVAQSITMGAGKAWLVINNSGLVHAIDAHTAKLTGTITGLSSPRYMLLIDENKAYVSDFFGKKISVVNPSAYQVTGEISTGGRSTEEMVLIGKFAYVANWSGYNQDPKNNVVLVIDTETDEVVETIEVGVEPNSLEVDKNGNLWVLCSGGFELQAKETATLWLIDPEQRSALDTLSFAELNMYPSGLELGPGNDTLYFLNNGIFKMGIDETEIPEDIFIEEDNGRNFGYLAVDPLSGDIYVADPLDYLSNGHVYQYATDGKFINTLTEAGIVPASFGFNK